jgi:hypothetical protein
MILFSFIERENETASSLDLTDLMNSTENLFGGHRRAKRGEQSLPSRKNVFDFIEGKALSLNVNVSFTADHVCIGTGLWLIAIARERKDASSSFTSSTH